MRSRNWIWRLAVAALAVLALAGCSTYATPDTSEIGLAYTGGSWDAKYFQKCVQPGGNEAIDTSGDTAYYPVGTRTWSFGDYPGADSGPILVSTKNQEIIASGLITFKLDTSCTKWNDGPDGAGGKEWDGGKIQKFHETIGRSKGAFFTNDSTVIPQGWRDTLGLFLGGPANRVMDTTAGDYTWQQLYSDPKIVKTFTDKVVKDLPAQIKDATGGDAFFEIISIQLDKPTLPDELVGQLRQQEKELLAQQTVEQKRAFIQNWPGGQAGYEAFQAQQRQDAETNCLNVGKCTLVPAGAPVAVPVSS